MNRLRERTTQPVVEDRAGASVAIGEWMDVLVGPKPLSRFFWVFVASRGVFFANDSTEAESIRLRASSY
jgi:hypothetical protein